MAVKRESNDLDHDPLALVLRSYRFISASQFLFATY